MFVLSLPEMPLLWSSLLQQQHVWLLQPRPLLRGSPVAGDSPWWERSLPGPVSQQSRPIHSEKCLLFCTPPRDHLRFLILPHCGFTPSLWGRSYFFWERMGPVFLPLLPFPSSAT